MGSVLGISYWTSVRLLGKMPDIQLAESKEEALTVAPAYLQSHGGLRGC
jgi:hypothetical protein